MMSIESRKAARNGRTHRLAPMKTIPYICDLYSVIGYLIIEWPVKRDRVQGSQSIHVSATLSTVSPPGFGTERKFRSDISGLR
jgi:hypothetical protein